MIRKNNKLSNLILPPKKRFCKGFKKNKKKKIVLNCKICKNILDMKIAIRDHLSLCNLTKIQIFEEKVKFSIINQKQIYLFKLSDSEKIVPNIQYIIKLNINK